MKRFALFVYVNLDPLPGTFHTNHSALMNTRAILENWIGDYNPIVAFAPDSLQPETPERVAFVVYVDMDQLAENPRNFAMRTVRQTLRDSMPQYNPVVSYAPRVMQPEHAEETA